MEIWSQRSLRETPLPVKTHWREKIRERGESKKTTWYQAGSYGTLEQTNRNHRKSPMSHGTMRLLRDAGALVRHCTSYHHKDCNVRIIYRLWLPHLHQGPGGWGHSSPGRRHQAGGVGDRPTPMVPVPAGKGQHGAGHAGPGAVHEPQVRMQSGCTLLDPELNHSYIAGRSRPASGTTTKSSAPSMTGR